MSNRVEYEIQVSDKFSKPLLSLNKHLKSVSKSFTSLTQVMSKYNKEEARISKSTGKRIAQSRLNHLERKQLNSQSKDLNLMASKSRMSDAKSKLNLEKSRFQLDRVQTVISKRKLETERAKHNLVKSEVEFNKRMGKMSKLAVGRGLASPVSMTNGKYRKPASPVPPQGGGMGGGRRGGFMMGGGLGSMGGMAKAMGYYELINAGVAVPRTTYKNIKEMTSLKASLSGLSKIVAKDMGTPGEEVAAIRGVADKYGVPFRNVADPYKNIIATGQLPADTAKKLIAGGAGYSSLMGLGAPAQESLFRAIEQMLSKEKITAEEFNRQLQQAPGMKNMFYEAFLKAVQKRGTTELKKDVTKDNVSTKFYEYMSKGQMASAPVITELVGVLLEANRDKQYIFKSHELRGEEARMNTAYQFMTTKIGESFEPQIKASLISITESFNLFASKIDILSKSIETWSGWFKDEKPTIAKGFAKGGVEAAKAVIELPGNLIKMGYDVGMYGLSASEGIATGDWSSFNKTAKDINKDWFNISSEKKEERNYISSRKDYSMIPKNSTNINQEQIIRVILEGKEMPANMSARVENIGGSSSRMRVESNFMEGY